MEYSSWTPLWSDIIDSSIWEEPLHVRVAFVTILASKDKNFVWHGDAYKLKKKANLDTLSDAQDALKVLCEPDAIRPGQKFDGRRLEPVEGGFLILNGEFYQEKMKRERERIMAAKRQKEYRERNKRGGQDPEAGAMVAA